MTGDRITTSDGILDVRARLPKHVVFREFADETVLLDIRSGLYYGLNRSAGSMLAAVDSHATVRDALALLIRRFPGERAVKIEEDLQRLCRELIELELLVLTR